MKNWFVYSRHWELLLIPVVAIFGFGVTLVFLSLALVDENSVLKAIRDSDFPTLKAADQNISRYEAIVVALNTAAATGEVEFLDVANGKASEILESYALLEKLDEQHKDQIDKLKHAFSTYFALAIDISRHMGTKTGPPSLQEISSMRTYRDAYLLAAVGYRDAAETDFHATVAEAIGKSVRAQFWGAVIGVCMLLAIMGLTWLVIRDIHKRRQIEAALRDSEEASRIAATAFEAHDAIVITDVDANIIRVNRAFTKITGYSAMDALGKNARFMKSGRHDELFYRTMWQQLLQTGTWAGEIWNRRKNGEVYPESMTISAVRNQQNETTHYVAISSDITERKRLEEEVHSLAFYDALTKLPNRRLFLDRFQVALTASARRDDYGAVLFIDLDRFKSLNDTLGHEYGDLLLIEVGVRIKACIRDTDTVARFGGDEFVVLIEAASNDRDEAIGKVALVAGKIREVLTLPYRLKEHQHHSSPSIGVCMYHGQDEPLQTLLGHADMAMYQVKRSGRNAVRLYDSMLAQDEAIHALQDN